MLSIYIDIYLYQTRFTFFSLFSCLSSPPYTDASQDWVIPSQARFEPMTGGKHWGKTTSSAFDSWRTYLNSNFVTPYSMSDQSMIPGLPKALRISDTKDLAAKMFGSGEDIMVVTNQIFPSHRVSLPAVQNMSVAYFKTNVKEK